MDRKFKIIIEKADDGFIGEVPELPGCYSQGRTKKELKNNIVEAIELYLETKKELSQKENKKIVGIEEVVVNA
jgi:predicted RNase H-like HicB family nuclease